jgi:hypothetical protein
MSRDIPPLPYLDRYRNEGTRSYSPHAGYSEASDLYRPDSATRSFGIPSYDMPSDGMNVYAANPTPELEGAYHGSDWVRFCIHPQVLEACAQEPYVLRTQALGRRRTPISASPSSSTRTLYVQDDAHPHALKLHFPFRVSRYGRRMRDEVVGQAIAVSAELEGWGGMEDVRFAFMREVIGVSHQNLDTDSPRAENWGYLVRDLVPFPRESEPRTLIPGFALYGGDYFDPERRPLLHDLVGGLDPAEWVLENVFLPIIRHWVACFRDLGFILEPHGQNVLLEVTPDGSVTRIVHRDLSVGIDMRRRRDLRLPDGDLNAYNRMETGEFLSIAYDKFMGGHFFDPLVAAVVALDPRLTPEDLRGPCRAEFAEAFPEEQEYFPRTVHYFAEERDQFGKPRFEDTGEAPNWRP